MGSQLCRFQRAGRIEYIQLHDVLLKPFHRYSQDILLGIVSRLLQAEWPQLADDDRYPFSCPSAF